MLWLALIACGAAQSLDDLERAYREKVAQLEKSRPSKPGPELDKWDLSCLDADWEHGIALLRLAEGRKDRDLYRKAVRHFTEFIWKYDDYLAALQARLCLARAHEALQEWGPCFAQLNQARRLDRPELRKDPQAVEVAVRSWTQELRARMAHGRGVDTALERLRNDLKLLPKEREDDPFLALRLETARAMHFTGRAAESERALRDIVTRHDKTDAGFRALGSLADLFKKDEDTARYADRLFQRHHFTEAIPYYGRSKKTPEAWLRLGLSYQNLGRLHEAAEALRMACAAPGPHQVEAAVRLLRVLRKLAETESTDALRASLAAHRDWMAKNVDLAQAGPVAVRILADGLAEDGKYKEAADLYARIAPGQEGYPEAVHSLGLCRFKLKEHDKAAEAFVLYLGLEKRTPRASDSALDLACWSLLAQGKAEETLKLTDRILPNDPVTREWRLAHRVDALGRLGRFKEAHETLAALKGTVATRPLARALERLALAYEQAIAKTGDRKLWGPYARIVVKLSEWTTLPLRGEKLLAAADALATEETAEGHALACDLYAQYLLDKGLRPDERRPVEHRRALSAFGCGKLEEALDIVSDLRRQDPMKGSYTELQGDIAAARAAKLPPGEERNRLLDESIRLYGELIALPRLDEHSCRLLWKFTTQLFARDPERARDFFVRLEKRGYKEWGDYQDRMDTLRKKVFDAAPPRR